MDFKANLLQSGKEDSYVQGHGIHIFNEIENLENLLKMYLQNNSNYKEQKMTKSTIVESKTEIKSKSFRIRDIQSSIKVKINSFIIQKYLERPLLFDNRKFDIRVWVMFTHEYKVYFFREGYIRTSSSTYTTNKEKIEDNEIHLTNNAVQKHSNTYGRF